VLRKRVTADAKMQAVGTTKLRREFPLQNWGISAGDEAGQEYPTRPRWRLRGELGWHHECFARPHLEDGPFCLIGPRKDKDEGRRTKGD
jgi:hypothetical protein